ncbi:MAG: hypothetical protein RL456_796 [Pseudomonadota bacterium]|jgi:hypothetical protein
MDEHAARQILLVKALETAGTEHPLWSADDRRWATRATLEEQAAAGPPRDTAAFVARRARHALERLTPREPRLRDWLGHRLWHARWAVAALAMGLAIGLVIDAAAPGRRIDLLAPGPWLLTAWSLLVGLLSLLPLPAGRLRRALARRTLDLRSLLRGARDPALAAVAQAWTEAARPLAGARAGVLLHLAGAGAGLGLLAGLYLRGLVLDYRAGWSSTFLDPATVHAVLSALFAPARWVSGLPMPDEAALAALRLAGDAAPLPGPAGSAAPWIHLHAVTLALLVVLPRLVMAAGSALRAAWLARRFPLTIAGDPYFEALQRQHLREQARVTLLPYAQPVAEDAAGALREWLRPLLGEAMQWQVAPVRAYGSEDEVGLQAALAGPPTLLVALFDLSATPEPEIHGRWLRALQTPASRAGARLIVAVESSAWTERFGRAAPQRVDERREAWRAFAAGMGLALLPLERGRPAGPLADLARDQLAAA